MKLSQLVEYANNRWPIDSKADWDNPGLAVGRKSREVRKVLLAVDVTPSVVEEAKQLSAQLIFSHHPLLFKGTNDVNEDSLKGWLITEAIENGIAIFSAHTNADFSEAGVSQTLARKLGLHNLSPLTQAGEGIAGDISPTTLVEFARATARVLPSVAQGILVQGQPERLISRVALVAGAGDSYLDAAYAADIDLFITSDLRHHPASDLRDKVQLFGGPALMNISHFSAEYLWLEQAASELCQVFPAVEFVVSELNTDPWDFAVMQ